MKNRVLISCLLAGAVLPTAALAQTTDIGRVGATGGASGGTADELDAPTATGVTRKEVAGGLMVEEDVPKAKSSVTRDFIQKQQPSADVFQIMKLSPGANAAAGDAYGLNQGLISVRGLEGGQMGFNFEGMPLNVASNWSVFPGQWIDTENTDVVTLNQGTADLASPNVTATGGVVDLFLHNPEKERGGLVDFSVGTNNFKRGFFRYETGEMGDSGMRAFFSYSHAEADHFRGPGRDQKDHFAAALVKDWGGGSKTKLAMTYTKMLRDVYKNPTLTQWKADGLEGDQTNYLDHYDTSTTGTRTSYYKQMRNPWENLLISAPSEFVLSDDFRLSVTPYFFYGYGASGAATVFANESSVAYGNQTQAVDLNGNGTTTDTGVLVYAPIFEDNKRYGITVKGDYTWNNHQLVAGIWYQYSRDELYRPYSTMDADGTPSDYKGESHYVRTADGHKIYQWYQDTRDRFKALFVGDTISFLDDRLKLDVGVKRLLVTREGVNKVPNDVGDTEANRDATLPTLAVRYQFGDGHQVYASAGKGYRVLAAGALYPRYNASSGALATRANPDQPSEESTAFEVGYRYHGSLLNLSTSLFNYQFKNRQISASVCDPACLSQPINGGKQRATGIDFEMGLKPWNNLRPYFSAEYMDTEILSDLETGGNVLPTKGKNAVRSPKWQAAAAVDYDTGVEFANLAVKYVGSQYATFMNDQKIPSYTTVDATLGYRFHSAGFLKRPEVRLNLLNLFDKRYLSGVYSPTFNANATTSVGGATVGGTAPSYLVGNSFTAVLTFATGF